MLSVWVSLSEPPQLIVWQGEPRECDSEGAQRGGGVVVVGEPLIVERLQEWGLFHREPRPLLSATVVAVAVDCKTRSGDVAQISRSLSSFFILDLAAKHQSIIRKASCGCVFSPLFVAS